MLVILGGDRSNVLPSSSVSLAVLVSTLSTKLVSSRNTRIIRAVLDQTQTYVSEDLSSERTTADSNDIGHESNSLVERVGTIGVFSSKRSSLHLLESKGESTFGKSSGDLLMSEIHSGRSSRTVVVDVDDWNRRQSQSVQSSLSTGRISVDESDGGVFDVVVVDSSIEKSFRSLKHKSISCVPFRLKSREGETYSFNSELGIVDQTSRLHERGHSRSDNVRLSKLNFSHCCDCTTGASEWCQWTVVSSCVLQLLLKTTSERAGSDFQTERRLKRRRLHPHNLSSTFYTHKHSTADCRCCSDCFPLDRTPQFVSVCSLILALSRPLRPRTIPQLSTMLLRYPPVLGTPTPTVLRTE